MLICKFAQKLISNFVQIDKCFFQNNYFEFTMNFTFFQYNSIVVYSLTTCNSACLSIYFFTKQFKKIQFRFYCLKLVNSKLLQNFSLYTSPCCSSTSKNTNLLLKANSHSIRSFFNQQKLINYLLLQMIKTFQYTIQYTFNYLSQSIQSKIINNLSQILKNLIINLQAQINQQIMVLSTS
ncbi:hypothetical protein ABPG72_021656 [Tetrahymena utriculariae]